MDEYVDMADQGVRLVPSTELARTAWNLPRATEAGYMRTICRGVIGAGASLGVGVVPVGQRSPLHTTDSEHLLLGLEGRLTWCVEGTDYLMGEMDLLFVGAGHEYEYYNSGFTQARFVDVIGRVDRWPFTAAYPT